MNNRKFAIEYAPDQTPLGPNNWKTKPFFCGYIGALTLEAAHKEAAKFLEKGDYFRIVEYLDTGIYRKKETPVVIFCGASLYLPRI